MSSVDVVVPCYRYAQFLHQCVDSALTQSGIDTRVLIIDDASPDNTAEIAENIVRHDSRVTFRRHAINMGHIATYNEGIEWASSDYMLILSADDYLLPGALRRAADLMDAHPEVGLTFGRSVELIDDVPTNNQASTYIGVFSKKPWHVVRGWEFIELSGAGNIVSTPTAIVRTELQKRVGGYRVELPHTGDMEMWLRFAAHASVGVLENYQAVYRRHSSNMSLAYMTQGWLPDLHQRKAALDYFFALCPRTIPNQRQLRRKMFCCLAKCAVGFASNAFNQGDLELSQKLSDFAYDICGEITTSWPWIKLVWKRRLGLRIWNAFRPIVSGIRQAAYRRPPIIEPKTRVGV